MFFLPAIRVTSIHGLKCSKVLSSNGRTFLSPIMVGLQLSTFQAFLESQTEWTKFHVFPKSTNSFFLVYLATSNNYQRMAFSTQFCSMKQDHLWMFYQPEVFLCCVCVRLCESAQRLSEQRHNARKQESEEDGRRGRMCVSPSKFVMRWRFHTSDRPIESKRILRMGFSAHLPHYPDVFGS